MVSNLSPMEMDSAKVCRELGPILIRIGSLLLSSGANTERIRSTLNRIAGAFQIQAEVFISHQTLQLYLVPHGQFPVYHHLKRSFVYANDFTLLSGISRMSWRIIEEKWSLNQINEELNRLEGLKHYPSWLRLFVVALAGAAFCRLFGGGPAALAVTFSATVIGQLVLRQAKAFRFNAYLCVFMASVVASMISLLFFQMDIAGDQEHLLPASLVFLIPGVPLINSFSDFIDGHILNGVLRTVNSLIIAFAIASGLLTALTLLSQLGYR